MSEEKQYTLKEFIQALHYGDSINELFTTYPDSMIRTVNRKLILKRLTNNRKYKTTMKWLNI